MNIQEEIKYMRNFLIEFNSAQSREEKQTLLFQCCEYMTSDVRSMLSNIRFKETLHQKVSDAIKGWPGIGFEKYRSSFTPANPIHIETANVI